MEKHPKMSMLSPEIDVMFTSNFETFIVGSCLIISKTDNCKRDTEAPESIREGTHCPANKISVIGK